MLHEYALDPRCLNEWDTFIRLTEQFGIPYGRLISQFPKTWLRIVHEVCGHFTFRQRQIMGDKLAKLKRQALIRSGRKYNSATAWIENAIQQHHIIPFHAIIADQNQEELEFVLIAKEIIAETALWSVPREAPIPRTADSLGAAVGPLLKMSKRILFVDKRFEPSTLRWQDALRKFLDLAIDGRASTPDFEYHMQYDHKDTTKTEEFYRYCDDELSGLVPAGVEIHLFRWDKKAKGEGIHARYILTERGGIRIDWGLDTGREGETTDVTLMDENLWKKRLEDYYETSETFDLMDKVCIKGKA